MTTDKSGSVEMKLKLITRYISPQGEKSLRSKSMYRKTTTAASAPYRLMSTEAIVKPI